MCPDPGWCSSTFRGRPVVRPVQGWSHEGREASTRTRVRIVGRVAQSAPDGSDLCVSSGIGHARGWVGASGARTERGSPAWRHPLRLLLRCGKLSGKASRPPTWGVDLVLLSHDQPVDNLDDSGRALLAEIQLVLSTVAASGCADGVTGLPTWTARRHPLPGGAASRSWRCRRCTGLSDASRWWGR